MEVKKMKANRVAYTTVTLTDKEIGQLVQENQDAIKGEAGKPMTAKLLHSLASSNGDEES
jgi:hypothetical protein